MTCRFNNSKFSSDLIGLFSCSILRLIDVNLNSSYGNILTLKPHDVAIVIEIPNLYTTSILDQ